MEFLPKDMLAALHEAGNRDAKRRSRLCVHAGGEIYRMLKRSRLGFSLDAAQVTHLRGLVDVYDGPRHVSQCLIVASEVEAGELFCTVKRETAVSDHPALDFARDETAPRGYLPRD